MYWGLCYTLYTVSKALFIQNYEGGINLILQMGQLKVSETHLPLPIVTQLLNRE